MKKPDCYKCPLRKRSEIADFIFAHTHQRFYHCRFHSFCFNVKCYDLDFSFDNLLQVFQEVENNPTYTHNDEWLRATRERFDKDYGEDSDLLRAWAQEAACGHFVSNRKDGHLDSDCFTHLWDGTPIDVRYSFEGRSGGWLSINRFEGYDFTQYSSDYWHGVLSVAKCDDKDEPVMDYATLRKFYQLIVMLVHDLRDEAIEKELELGAAWAFFANVCSDLPQPNELQLKLEFAQ